jgi:hypothetical protein
MKRRTFVPAIILSLLSIAAVPASIGNAPHVIKEGVGWDRFSVGANANYLMDVLGSPDKHSQGRMMKWSKAGLNCLLDDTNQAMELRFEKRFHGATERGVTFGMPSEQVRKIYGDAGKLDWRGGGMKLIWPSRGILIWFNNNKVYQIVIFKPQG